MSELKCTEYILMDCDEQNFRPCNCPVCGGFLKWNDGKPTCTKCGADLLVIPERDEETGEELAEMEDTAKAIGKKHNVDVILHRAPEDPKHKREWIERMKRLQIGMWINDGAKCVYCGHVYGSYEDFIERNPRAGFFDKDDLNYFDKMFVCDACWKDYLAFNRGKTHGK